jgi:hypothetical protein
LFEWTHDAKNVGVFLKDLLLANDGFSGTKLILQESLKAGCMS